MREHLAQAWGSGWGWFVERARGPHALFWLIVCAFLDPIFFPVAPEIYLATLMLAQPDHWRRYVPVAIAASTAGAVAGYFIGAFLFSQFGAAIVGLFGLDAAFAAAQAQLGASVFAAMLVVPFTLIPEKVFVLAAGFVGAPFVPFILGFLIGRAARIGILAYLVHRFGRRILELAGRYFFWFTALLVLLAIIYGIVRFNVLGF